MESNSVKQLKDWSPDLIGVSPYEGHQSVETEERSGEDAQQKSRHLKSRQRALTRNSPQTLDPGLVGL